MGAAKRKSDLAFSGEVTSERVIPERAVAERAFLEARAAFDEIETRMGELAAYLSDIADALTDNPESLDRSLAGEWPDAGLLFSLRRTWMQRRDELVAAWRKLPPSRRTSHPLPALGAFDRSRAVV